MWVLLAVNIIVALLFYDADFSLTIVLVYVIQSIIIGAFQYLKMRYIKINFSPKDFLLFFGMWHVVLLLFISSFPFQYEGVIVESLLISSGIFLLNHAYSYFLRPMTERERNQPTDAMLIAIVRILPLNFAIILWPVSPQSTVVFLLFFKIIADVLLHGYEHYRYAYAAKTQ